ncbi:nucleotidyltransferase domain-containing protein [Planotetraspora kaengkrachanensis]|uniref:Nucleotidyltransferase n=1 Tax=Planotetraspora kaengkrachanensis TaxID=575193 RepID=A0A8J3PUS1_9ACTN|nr:nucleotidyltransferase domain-containing protein [Planotetraspora kaengkrachanensis]GIG81466.1 nucleotidyltransferase [Planotetraspora kaengkrachanensis]
MPEGTVLSVVTGSRAYGLDGEGSDVDRRGVFVIPTPMFWRLDKPPTHLDGPMAEQFSWEVERFCVLAMRANPTVLECLWSPIVEHATPVGEELLAIRSAFLSREAERTFAAYSDDQFRRLESRGGEPPGPDARFAAEPRFRKMTMHLLRLLAGGLHLVRHGEPLVRVDDGLRARLLAVRHGATGWQEAKRWRAELTGELSAAIAGGSALPDKPGKDVIEDFLMRVRRSAL